MTSPALWNQIKTLIFLCLNMNLLQTSISISTTMETPYFPLQSHFVPMPGLYPLKVLIPLKQSSTELASSFNVPFALGPANLNMAGMRTEAIDFPAENMEARNNISISHSTTFIGIDENFKNFSVSNSSFDLNTLEMPAQYTQMTQRSRNEVVAYAVLFVVAATGNLTVFFSVCHQLARLKWRITVLMLHLSIADLIVTFFLMPLEIFWRITIQWVGGESLCRICQFFRAFGLYLSSNILICICLDRFMAILYPLRMVGATRRVKTMIAIAWIVAAISSLPQCFVFNVQAHPQYPSFKQCVSFGVFSKTQEIIYNLFSVSAMYFIPLLVTIFTYSMILWKIISKSNGYLQQHTTRGGGNASVRQDLRNSQRSRMLPSSNSNPTANVVGYSESANLLARAKKRTLRMTFIIVIAFVFCWTPYAVITLWYTFDKEGAEKLEPSLQDALFMMAVANSCLNPIVYGNYTKKTAGPIYINCFTIRCFSHGERRRISIEENRIVPNESNQKRTSSQLAITSVI